MLPEFELLTSQTLSEALKMLAESDTRVMPLAGGTNVIVTLRESGDEHQVLMDVSRLPELRGIHRENGHVVVGGGTTMTELMMSPLVAEKGAPLKDAAAHLGSPLVRNRATLAGNLVDASPAADTAPPLLALDAEVELVSLEGTRNVPLKEFVVGVNKTVLRRNELLVAVRWPVPSGGTLGVFRKIGLRKALACSVVTAAAMVEKGEDGVVGQARIALGAVAPTPIRAQAAEEVLRGCKLTPNLIAEAARLSAEATRPIDDVRGTAVYRRRVSEVLVRRMLTEIARV